MKIEKISVNAYGNIHDKEILLEDGINIIKGSNESGKSTLQSYISNIFYGISKNKDGKGISDYEKYKPWVGKDFSGKLSYKLDNGEKYEVYRDFNKKNPKIYNNRLEDISSNFEIDKKEGNRFFSEQTGLDKQAYLSTVGIAQQEVRLDEKEQNILVQKIANLAGTGEENVSYKKALTKLDNKIRDEIGTNKTTQKPINILEEKIQELDSEIEKIKPYQNKKYSIDIIEQLSKKVEITNEIKRINNNQEINKNNININKKKQIENLEKLKQLSIEKEKFENENNNVLSEIKKLDDKLNKNVEEKEYIINKLINIENKSEKNNINIFYLIIEAILLIAVITGLIIKNNLLLIISGILFILTTIFIIIKYNKIKKENNNIINKNKNELNTEKNNIEKDIEELKNNIQNKKIEEKENQNKISMLIGQLDLLEMDNTKLNKNIEELENRLKNNTDEERKNIFIKYNNFINKNELEELFDLDDISQEIENIEKVLNEKKLKYKSLEIEEKNILPQIDAIVQYEEKKEEFQQEYLELQEKREVINLAIQNLQEAYEEMKTTITPKFIFNLSKVVSNITNDKYNKVNINDEYGMVVENEKGDYIELNKLSIGTIDELYLSLRLSMVDELAKENMPIILDETFAYFDEARLTNILKYLYEELKSHQIIIFTCTDRECLILKKLNLEYNLIEMN